jgi:hypothetical protein
VIRASVRQLRVGMGGPFGLDFGAVLAMGAALGADQRMLAELLPAMEKAALDRLVDGAATDREDE